MTSKKYDFSPDEISNFMNVTREVSDKPRTQFEPDLAFLPTGTEATIAQQFLVGIVAVTAQRMSVRQILAFLIFADSDVRGAPMTLQNLRDMTISGMEEELFSASVARSFEVFFERSEDDDENAERLAWLYRVTDEYDKRLKYVRLTATGKKMYQRMLTVMG